MAGAATTSTGTSSGSSTSSGNTCKVCGTTISKSMFTTSTASQYVTYQTYYSVSTKSNLSTDSSKYAYKNTNLRCVNILVDGVYYPICMSCLEKEVKNTSSGSSTTTKSYTCVVCSASYSLSSGVSTSQPYTTYFKVDAISDLKTLSTSIVYTNTTLRAVGIIINNVSKPICMSCLETKIANHREGTVVDIDTGSASVPITVTRTAMTFSVTVPTTLPVDIAADGTITTADNVVITNSCPASIVISQIEVQSLSDWTLIPYSKGVGGSLPPDDKNVGLQLIAADKSFATKADGESEIIGSDCGVTIASKSSCSIKYVAEISAQLSALASEQVANVIFTVDWAE